MERLDLCIEHLRAFTTERDWDQYHTPENLAKSISIESAELLECFQWSNDFDINAVKDEIADVMIYCMMLADTLHLDAVDLMEEKLKKNIAKYPVDKCRGQITKYDKIEPTAN